MDVNDNIGTVGEGVFRPLVSAMLLVVLMGALVGGTGCVSYRAERSRVLKKMGPEGAVLRAGPWKRLSVIKSDTFLRQIAEEAAVSHAHRSVGPGRLRQKLAERRARGLARWPQVFPVAEVNSEDGLIGGLRAEMALWDFGLSRSGIAEADLEIQRALLDYWTDQNQAVRDAIVYLLNAAEAKAIIACTEESQRYFEVLHEESTARVQAKVADLSEIDLVELRMSELENEINLSRTRLDSSLALLSDLINRYVEAETIPSFEELSMGLAEIRRGYEAPEVVEAAPSMLTAYVAEEIAVQQRKQAKAQRIPRLLLRATGYSREDGFESLAGLTLDAGGLSVFTTSAMVDAANGACVIARAETESAMRAELTKRKQIGLMLDRLDEQEEVLLRLVKAAENSVELYKKQRLVGARPITDGLIVYRTLLQSQRDLISVRARRLENRIELGALDGRLWSLRYMP